jgi:shikimate dehydrogenase
MIFALIGGQDIKKYSIADILWEKILKISDIDFEFKIIPINNFTELCKFYWSFSENPEFIGFNVALPWKSEIIKLIDVISSNSKVYSSINTVYKTNNNICGSNTDILGIERSLLNYTDLYDKNILVIGSGGAGLPTSEYLSEKYHCKVFTYDLNNLITNSSKITRLKNIPDIGYKKYDVIINATPVGKFYLTEIPKQFSSPISLDLFKKITHEKSIIQEMNYFPLNTEILKFGISSNLQVISGIEMLVYQACSSFELYTGYKFDNCKIRELITFVKNYVINKEYELFR